LTDFDGEVGGGEEGEGVGGGGEVGLEAEGREGGERGGRR